jgi:hypothetical protein
MAYHVSVLLIEAQEMMPVRALPVHGHGFGSAPGTIPQIEQIQPQFAEPGQTITLRGKSLVADRFTVQIGETELIFDAANPPQLTDTGDLQISLPPDLPAGIRSVRLSQQVATRQKRGAGQDAEAGPGTSQVVSNTAVFVLRPRLSIPASPPAPNTIAVDIAPVVQPGQRGVLLLNEWKEDPDDQSKRAAYSIELPAVEQATEHFTVKVPGVAPGRYLVRLQIDGAESNLELAREAGEDQPRFVNPKVVIS